MAALIATGATGSLMTTDAYRPARWLEEAHGVLLASLTLGLVFIHVAAVLAMSAWHGENLVRVTITGRKRQQQGDTRKGHWIVSPPASMIV
jgi:cytochrome b